ncbi:hypothetical protein ABZW47_29450 [Streptomyces sp. NPDC004549]|uniref:hypothetical protein n=1 Tax=Streptomyces sp. NPDC004549 TaxID=3154283 RepID=UPI0033B45A9E
MSSTLRMRTALDLAEAARPQPVGPGWEVLLMPEPLGRLMVGALAGRPSTTTPLGWVFAHADQWGIFLPSESDELSWPPGTTYLKAGASVTLPPEETRPETWTGAYGWVSRDGPPLSRPLLIHPVLAVLGADDASVAPCAPGPPGAAAGRRAESPTGTAERAEDTE